MTTYNMNTLRVGTKIIMDEYPCVIVGADLVKPGKGQAFTRVRFRNYKTGRVLERTFKAGDSIEGADVVDIELQYLYGDGEYWYFMDQETFEQHQADANALGEAWKWLKDQDICTITLWNGVPISVAPPNFVTLKITKTDPGVRGDTASGGAKPATLETDAVVKVPLFVEEGETIKVDTRTGEYVSRVKG
ncbi:MAG: elongation factor P [Gammaproteobacteria bacterium]|nr:elongation factor P [Gammaproteobacteria bacterium]